MSSSHPTIPTKLGQPSSASPRTLETNRRRLGALFTSLAVSPALSRRQAPRPRGLADHDTPTTQAHRLGDLGETERGQGSGTVDSKGRSTWLSTSTHGAEVSEGIIQLDEADELDQLGKEWDEGCFVDGSSDNGECPVEGCLEGCTRVDLGHEKAYIDTLPDELLVYIFTHLCASSSTLVSLSLVSRRFHNLARAPVLWSSLFHSTPGFRLAPGYQDRIVATAIPLSQVPNDIATHCTPISNPDMLGDSDTKPDIMMHFPTLYRSRRDLSRQIRSPECTPQQYSLTKHTDAVYCLDFTTPWLITGSRDRTIRFWLFPEFNVGPQAPQFTSQGAKGQGGGLRLVKTVEEAHGGSILAVRLEMKGKRGTILTGSSDMTAGLWEAEMNDVAWRVEVTRVGTLRGHVGGVLDVVLGRTRIATASKDTTIRIYDRSSLEHVITLTAHIAPVNCLSLNPCSKGTDEMVSASGDAYWIVWDMSTGQELRRGGGDARGLACVVWKGPYILTGDNDRCVKLFDASTGTLLRTFEGHTDLVRSVALDVDHGVIVSGSYDKSVRVWDVSTGQSIRRYGHSSLVFGVGMDQGRIVSVSHDHSVQVTTFGAELPYRGLMG